MRARHMLILLLILVLATAAACSSPSPAEPLDPENGALDPIDLSGDDETDPGEEDTGEFDEIDLSMGCPDEPTYFSLDLTYLYHVDDAKGYLEERTAEGASVQVQISSTVSGSNRDPIDVIIEGQSGDCPITGEAGLNIQVTGTCSMGVASLTISEEYENYRRSVECPGQDPIVFTDSVIPFPGFIGDFNISMNGDTQGVRQVLDQFILIYEYTLRPEEVVPIPTPE